MRIAALASLLVACGGHPGHTPNSAPVLEFPAARWIPAAPTYVVAAPTLREAQHALVDTLDTVGMLAGIGAGDASRGLTQILGVDPLSPEAVAAIGVDPNGSVALFSEDVSPTFVVQLATPEATAAFFDHQRELGMVTQSVIVDGNEVFTAKLDGGVRVGWAVAKDWLWVHFALPGSPDDTGWFAHSHRAEAATWAGAWRWARELAGKRGVVGFVRLRELVDTLAVKAPQALACARLLQPISRIALGLDAGTDHLDARFTLDLGPSVRGIADHVLPPPPGFAAASAGAPLSAQWNVDLAAVEGWLRPCLDLARTDFGVVDEVGVRAARVVVRDVKPDDEWGTGAVALDISKRDVFAKQLDRIPMRSHFESDRAFGAYRGRRLSIPFKGTIDYVLDDRVAIAAIGDGLLDALATGAPAPLPPPLAAVEVNPPALPQATWAWLLDRIGAPRAEAFAARLVRWHDLHLAAAVTGDSLVLDVAGKRR